MLKGPRNRTAAVACLAAGLGWLASCESAPRAGPAAPAARPVNARTGDTSPPGLERFLRIRTPASPTLAPDGALYVRDWPDGVWQLYKVTPAPLSKLDATPDYRPGHATFTRLTDYRDGLSSYSLSPDGRRLVLSYAAGGNENYQLSVLDASTGAITPLLTDPKVRHEFNAWLDDSSGFVYAANAESPEDFFLYRWDLASGRATRLLAEKGAWGCVDAAPDASRFLVGKFTSASDSQLFELDASSGVLTELTVRGSEPTAANNAVGYLPGARSILFTSDHAGGMTRLYLKDLETGSVTSPLPDLDRFEVDGAALSLEKDLLALVTNEDGFGVLRVFTVPQFRPVALPAMDRGVASPASFRGRRLVWTLSNARTPGEAYATDIPVAGAQLAAPRTFPVTHADRQGIDLSTFPLPELVRYPSFDGLEVPAFVFFPPGYDLRNPRPIPFICNFHGGPEGQHRPTFSAQNQYFLSRGFGIIMPNVRGSTGYGRAYHMMDDYRNRWASVKDGVAAARFLVERGWSAPGRIATYGGSYGGYMSVACLVEDAESAKAAGTPPLFGAGVDVVGVVNLRTFLEKTSGYRRKLREAEYGPLADPEFLDSVSPLPRADAINVPLLIAHGANDPRVPLNEAIQLSVALLKRGVPVEQLYFPDEGHGFAKLDNRLLFGRTAAGFLERTIGK